MFAERASFFQGIPNALYREKEAITRTGSLLIDLVSANLHAHGIHYPRSILKRAFSFAASQAKNYCPDPQGQQIARGAIQKYYAEEGVSIPDDQIVLTPGTSLSYLYLFKLLADSRDEILCPTPTYPLFDSIAALCDVKIVSYRLAPSRKGSIGGALGRDDASPAKSASPCKRWEIDFDHLQSKISEKTRALILISPHNPTGHVANETEIKRFCAIARKHDLPIISDEVFSPFLFKAEHLFRPVETDAPLVFTLNGISKMLALPGVKIGWIAVTGGQSRVEKSVHLLKGISDTFLPVNEDAQFALPALLHDGKPFMKSYQAQIRHRFQMAVLALMKMPECSFIPPEGGFYLAIKMKDQKSNEEKIALELLRKEKILVHPGFFYDLPSGYLVLSFVSQPALFKKNMERMAHILGVASK